MSIDIEKWISRLPLAEELAAEGILLSGQIINGGAGKICVLSGALRLTFSQDDVLKMENSLVEGQSAIVIRRKAPLLELESMPSELCDVLSSKRRPFALAVRSRNILVGPSQKYRNLERQFLVNEGLLEE